MSADERNRESDLAVMDAQEFKQKRRLKTILDAREKVEEKADTAEELYIKGEIAEVGRQMIVLRAVREYIRECWNLLIEHHEAEHGNDDRCEWLEERPLGTIDLPRDGKGLPVEYKGRRVEIAGLYQLLHCEEIHIEEWRERREYPHGSDEWITQTEEHAIPLSVSWQGYLTLNEFLSHEHDLEVRFEEMDDSLPTWGFEEVPDIPGTEEVDHDENPTPGEALGDD
jgi:hypothetical protein